MTSLLIEVDGVRVENGSTTHGINISTKPLLDGFHVTMRDIGCQSGKPIPGSRQTHIVPPNTITSVTKNFHMVSFDSTGE